MAISSDAHKFRIPGITIGVVLLASGFITSLNADEFLSEHYLGCFYNDGTLKENAISRQNLNTGNPTFERCIQRCMEGLKSYARLQNGSYCECVDEPGLQVNDSLCNKSCGETSSQFCGGTIHTLFATYVLYTVCPIGTYGAQCRNACHCEGRSSCNRNTGRCPNGCHEDYIGTTCSVLKSLSEQYIGCYNDAYLGTRALSHAGVVVDNNYMSLRWCSDLCSSRNYSYTGTQYWYQCFCGESYDRYGTQNANCNYTCRNSREFCGGQNVNSVYHTCPSGNYGHNCAKVCNCQIGRCTYHHGTCPHSICKPGWTGNACSLRDCSANNGGCGAGESCVAVTPIVSRTISVCRCPDGYGKVTTGGSCTDIDECTKYPGICGPYAEFCSNTEGGYACRCLNGGYVYNVACSAETDKSAITMKAGKSTIIMKTDKYTITLETDAGTTFLSPTEGSIHPFPVIIAAVGSGVVVAVICLIGIVFCFCSKRSRREQRGQRCNDNGTNRSTADANADYMTIPDISPYQTLNRTANEDAAMYEQINRAPVNGRAEYIDIIL